MKELWKSGIVTFFVIGVLYILYLRECKHPLPCPPEGQVLIPQSSWDSILALANKPPEIKIETLKITLPPVIPPQTPIPDPVVDPIDSTINHYADSLVRSDVNVHINLSVRGQLIDRLWWYRPISTQILKEKIVYVPHIVQVEKVVKTPEKGLFVYAVAGGNLTSFVPGAGIDYITAKQTEIGYMYQKFGNEGFHSVKIGTKIQFKKK